MAKKIVCILFGGISPEHEVSLRSAESVLMNIDKEKYTILPVGITKEGQWILFGGEDYSLLPDGSWASHPDNCRAFLSPVRGQGLVCLREEGYSFQRVDVVFPVLHGENGEDGAMQGLLQRAGIPFVGSHLAESAVSMDKVAYLCGARGGLKALAARYGRISMGSITAFMLQMEFQSFFITAENRDTLYEEVLAFLKLQLEEGP